MRYNKVIIVIIILFTMILVPLFSQSFWDGLGQPSSCHTCFGNGQASCRSCWGSGSIQETKNCTPCNGSGQIRDRHRVMGDERCRHCRGSGQEVTTRNCSPCLGTGNVFCMTCNGRGTLPR